MKRQIQIPKSAKVIGRRYIRENGKLKIVTVYKSRLYYYYKVDNKVFKSYTNLYL